ncbi:MAG: HAMP domain-containing histidine kinase [Burkholderiaceae bacterium]|jgi:two-component system sensor histidine kinase PilS (NtrC family)|nr:HAMP domain-containing histidine kinase [Burkholderiaceae bacterium]
MSDTQPPGTSSEYWFSTSLLPAEALTPENVSTLDDAGFVRLWSALMSARTAFAGALLLLHGTLSAFVRNVVPWVLALCAAYFVATMAVRWLAKPRPPGRRLDSQWFYTVGLDLLVIAILLFAHASELDYALLFTLPILISATLGSQRLAVGTAALATLLLLAYGVWGLTHDTVQRSSDLVQLALTCAGLVIIGWLTNLLAWRLMRQEVQASQSRAEAHMQTLVNNMVIEGLTDGVLVVDADSQVQTANLAARRMLFADRDILPHAFNLGDDPAWMQLAQMAQLTFIDGPISSVEVTLKYLDRPNSRLLVRTQSTPAQGRLMRPLCVMFMQDQRVTEARLRTEKLASMGRMSAAVAHEIRNPLAAISQANALLEEELENPSQKHLAAMVRQNAKRLDSIVNDILDVVRIEQNGGGGDSDGPMAEYIDLDAQVRAICTEWAAQHALGARLLLKLDAAGQPVRFKAEHLRRVLVNLLGNAARYASGAPSAIQIITRSVADGPVSLTVWSDSQQLESSVRRHLFEPFFSSESRSSGLGLFICRELCTQHGAEIAYERARRTQEGRLVDGNEFFVSFQRLRTADPQPAPEPPDSNRP